ncbi:tetratricopeptide repeat protein [Leptospira sp. WS58.C1]|uniref:tetratricopeptide repeat protein n=1 Tax=Leptospira cinconiae TaxID=3235173 RepID=UPI00349E7828
MRSLLYILLICSSFSPSFPQEENRREWNKAAKQKVLLLHQSGKEAESLPFLEEYVKKNPNELVYKLYLARALFWRADLELPGHSEDVFSRMEKVRKIRDNYLRAASLFEENVGYLAKVSPRDPDLGKWTFLWAMSEWYAGREDRAIQLFKKSFKHDFRLNQANYNIGAIYESLGQILDSQIYYGTYLKNEKELKEEE